MKYLKRYWAGFKDGKLLHETIGSDDGDFLVPSLYVSKEVAKREMVEFKKFDEIRRVEIVEINHSSQQRDDYVD